jgi:hypothetical protein
MQGSDPGSENIFLFTTTSRPALPPTKPSIPWKLGLFAWGKADRTST